MIPASLLIFLTAISTALSMFLAVYAWQRRNKPGVLAFAWLMIAATECSLVSGLSMLSRTAEAAGFWTKIFLLGIAANPVFFLIFILQYSGKQRWLSRPRIVLLFIIPLITQVMVWTNDMHGLILRTISFERVGSLMFVQIDDPGSWFKVQIIYTYLLNIAGVISIVAMIIRPFHLYRKQAIGLLIGTMPPLVNGMFIYLNLFPAVRTQLIPFAYTLMGVIFAWTLFYQRFLDVVPVARGTLFDSMNSGILVLDKQNRIVDLNRAAQHLLELSHKSIGQAAVDALQSRHDLAGHLHQDMQGQTEIALKVHEITRDYNLKITPLTDKRGERTGKLIVLEDISERKQAEAELQEKNAQLHELNASKDKFFSIISHDLREPFSTLLGFSEILEQNIEKFSLTEIKQRVHWLHGSTERLYALLENLLTWSRLQRGIMQQRPEPIQLFHVAEDNMALFAPKADQKEIELTQNMPKHLWAYADYSMVNTVMRNLISNALKFTPAEGHIEVSARELNDVVEITVSDTGVGIYPGDLPKLFRIDVQYTHIGTAGERGSGLGLILCQELVERNSGKIWVESEVGKGTLFRFTLPRQKREEEIKKEYQEDM